MVAQANGQNLAKSKEVAGMIAGALELAQQAGTISSDTKPADLTLYMTYLNTDTSSIIDALPGMVSFTCSSTTPCIKLSNGGMLIFANETFSGTNTTNAIEFSFDPRCGQ